MQAAASAGTKLAAFHSPNVGGQPQLGDDAPSCPYQKVHLVAHQHIPPRDLNAARGVNLFVPSAGTEIGAHVVPARKKEATG
jgi:hypothetical protein